MLKEAQAPVSIKEQARQEIIEEKTREWTNQLKDKMRSLQTAKTVVANLEREINLLEAKIEQEIKDING